MVIYCPFNCRWNWTRAIGVAIMVNLIGVLNKVIEWGSQPAGSLDDFNPTGGIDHNNWYYHNVILPGLVNAGQLSHAPEVRGREPPRAVRGRRWCPRHKKLDWCKNYTK